MAIEYFKDKLTISMILIGYFPKGDFVKESALREDGEDEEEDAEAADDEAADLGRDLPAAAAPLHGVGR